MDLKSYTPILRTSNLMAVGLGAGKHSVFPTLSQIKGGIRGKKNFFELLKQTDG